MNAAGMIRDARVAAGLTQAQLAGRMGMTAQGVSRLERGTHVPSLVTLRRVANALGVDLTVKFAGEEDPVDGVEWRRPSLCHGGECAEVADVDGEILVRVQHGKQSGMLRFSYAEWRAFTGSIKLGEFDIGEEQG